MTLSRALFSSASGDWSTPEDFYQTLNREFLFTYDPCPLYSERNGLVKDDWEGQIVYCNPPYGPKIREWLLLHRVANIAVYLLPARTDTRWFHEIVLPEADEIRFIKGRLRFGGSKTGAPFPSMVVIFR